MRSAHNQYLLLKDSISRSSTLQPFIIESLVKDLLAMEAVNLESNLIVNNELGALANELRISHCEILLSLLRRNENLTGLQ